MEPENATPHHAVPEACHSERAHPSPEESAVDVTTAPAQYTPSRKAAKECSPQPALSLPKRRKPWEQNALKSQSPAGAKENNDRAHASVPYTVAMTITLKDFQAFVEERMREAIANPDLLQAKFKEITDFGFTNETSMDAEANAHFYNLLKTIANVFEIGLSNVPDSPDKRRMLRAIAGTRRKHHRSQDLLNRLGMPYPVPRPIVEAARPIFLEAHQSILDLLWDATQQSQDGAAQFATLGLLYWTVDELTAAFYLAERRYTTQAYNHLRTVHDLLDKVQLFFHHPEWAEVWGSSDQQKIRKELSPGAIRKKLGKPKFDPVYGFFTELGTHGTFEALRKRVTQTGKKDGRTQVAMRIGGTPWENEVDTAIACCIMTVLSTLITIGQVYQTRLHAGEVMTILRSSLGAKIAFLQQYFVDPGLKAGIDASALIDGYKKLMLTLEEMETIVKSSGAATAASG